jgi:prevent-host-death family protein
MHAVGIRELKQRTSAILRQVRDHGDVVEVTYHGRAIARLVPLAQPVGGRPAASWKAWDALAEAIGRRWPRTTSALDAVREQRRPL